MKCSICEKEIEKIKDSEGEVIWDHGNNAEPVNRGRCCNSCNSGVVLPARLGMVMSAVNTRGEA
jgi:transcriptional regulator NrdR family protein